MLNIIRKHASTIVVAMVTAAVTAAAPAIATTVADFAKNADKVDHKDAVGSSATIAQRKGKLVATSGKTGRLPTNIIGTSGLRTVVAGKAYSLPIDNFQKSTFTPIVSTTITAPARGFLLVVGSVGARDDSGDLGSSDLQVRITVDGKAATKDPAAYELASDSNGKNIASAAGLNITVPVGAGKHKVAIVAKEVGAGSFLEGRSISAAYFPKGAGVKIPA